MSKTTLYFDVTIGVEVENWPEDLTDQDMICDDIEGTLYEKVSEIQDKMKNSLPGCTHLRLGVSFHESEEEEEVFPFPERVGTKPLDGMPDSVTAFLEAYNAKTAREKGKESATCPDCGSALYTHPVCRNPECSRGE